MRQCFDEISRKSNEIYFKHLCELKFAEFTTTTKKFTLHGLILHGVILHGVILYWVILHGVILHGVILHGVILHGIILHRVIYFIKFVF